MQTLAQSKKFSRSSYTQKGTSYSHRGIEKGLEIVSQICMPTYCRTEVCGQGEFLSSPNTTSPSHPHPHSYPHLTHLVCRHVRPSSPSHEESASLALDALRETPHTQQLQQGREEKEAERIHTYAYVCMYTQTHICICMYTQTYKHVPWPLWM